jgi:hypothetical protein
MISVCHLPSTLIEICQSVGHPATIARCPLTSRLIRKTLLPPSGPTLASRSGSIDEPRLNAGEGAMDGPVPVIGDMAGEYGRRVSRRNRACAGGTFLTSGTSTFLTSGMSGFSSSSVSWGSSLRLRESNWAFQIRSISERYICCCSATLYL